MIAKRLFASSVGRKATVAVTGSLLILFLIVHMLGNWNMFLGQEAMNQYAATLKGMPAVLWGARIGLLLFLVLHVALTISLNIENRVARPNRYAYGATVRATFASRTMVVSGLVLLSFIVFHLLHYTVGKVQPESFHITDAKSRHDVYSMVIYGFSNPLITGGYIIAMFTLAMHLNHAIQSLFQTMGLMDKRGMQTARRFAVTLSAFLFLGFSAVPVAVLARILSLPAGG